MTTSQTKTLKEKIEEIIYQEYLGEKLVKKGEKDILTEFYELEVQPYVERGIDQAFTLISKEIKKNRPKEKTYKFNYKKMRFEPDTYQQELDSNYNRALKEYNGAIADILGEEYIVIF